MSHSPQLARPFESANTHSWVLSESSDKAIEGVTPLISDRAIFQKSFAALPVVTYQAGETVITEGSRTGRLLILGKGAVAIVKEDTEIAKVAEPGAVFGELSVLLDQPHTADVRALETSQFHVADAASLFTQDPIAVLYVATVMARRLDGANQALIQLKSQLLAGQPNSVVTKTVSKIEELLTASGASLVYAGYPFDPFAVVGL
jgi:CRP/FNR family transcriptional regulator, cyclic AMP receptor protein